MVQEHRSAAADQQQSSPGKERTNHVVESTKSSSTSTPPELSSHSKSKSKSKSRSKSKTAKKKKMTKHDDDPSSTLTRNVQSTNSKPKTKSSKTKKKKKKSLDNGESLDRTFSTYSDHVPVAKSTKSALSVPLAPSAQTKTKNTKTKKKKIAKSLDKANTNETNLTRTKSFERDKSPKRNVKRSKSFDEVGSFNFFPSSESESQSQSQPPTDKNPSRGSALCKNDGRCRERGSPSPRRGKGRERGPPLGDRETTRSTSRSRSVDLERINSFDSKGSGSRGRRRSGDETYPIQSRTSNGFSYTVPPSILRKSSHGRGVLNHSSHHTLSSYSQHKPRVSVHLTPDDLYSGFASDTESDAGDDDDDDNSFGIARVGEKSRKELPRTLVRSISKSMKHGIHSFMTMDMSGHSRGLGTGSSHHTNDLSRVGIQSTRILPKTEKPKFEGESRFIGALRYIHILAPYPNEGPIKKKIRIVTWLALFFDFLNALVAIITYGGETTQCCGESIMSAFGGFDWDKTILIATTLYMFLIFLEVLPVMRDVFPFNLFNPFIGFLITFAVFFSDSIMEAAIMWTIEALAVGCEVFSYRLRIQLFGEHKVHLKQSKREIQELRKIKRKAKDRSENGTVLTRTRSDDLLNIDLECDSFEGDDSFCVDEMEFQNNSADIRTIMSRSAHTTASDIGDLRETRLLRERRQLINSQAEDERELHYHLIGVSINVFLVILSLLMIVIIAKNGGMCIKGMKFGNIFKNDQLEKCYMYKTCENPSDCEEYCPRDGNGELSADSQCYYPYGTGK